MKAVIIGYFSFDGYFFCEKHATPGDTESVVKTDEHGVFKCEICGRLFDQEQ